MYKRQVHKVRSFFNTGSYVSGTGFLVDKSLVENGWNYHTLTEDIEFSADCAYKGIKIGYVLSLIHILLEKHIIPIVIKLHILKNISEYVNIMVKHLLLN